MRNFIVDSKTRDILNRNMCGNKECNNTPTHVVFIIESLDQANLLGVSCEEHKDTLGEIFAELGVRTQVMTEPLEQFKKRIAGF